jgi:hypothetical protein
LVLGQAVWGKFSFVLDRSGTVVVGAVVPSLDVSPMQLVGVADGKDGIMWVVRSESVLK